ncbi:M23 family metallopeptidase [Aurantiacibacter marinus]|uniref:M23 family metallopeptidase n=1 Tax=Aurantiacibacter marinus TaxID=874156 RepID=UPI001E5B0FB7|nr:M23 family metallopeptidase [Aurantiacibacter marinus]
MPQITGAQDFAAVDAAADVPLARDTSPTVTVLERPRSGNSEARSLISIGFDTVAGERRYAVRSANDNGVANVRFSSAPPRGAGFAGDIPDRLPVSRVRLTSQYGYRVHPVTGRGSNHSGIDLAVSTGTPVVATADGEVRIAHYQGAYGLLVALDHGEGVQTRYAHLSSIAVSAGQMVSEGDLIGRSGSTGRSTGPHLHYEVRVNGASVNPLPAS